MKWLTPEQVAEDPRLPLGNADWVRAQLRRGRLRGSRVGGRWAVPIATEPGETDAIDDMLAAGSNEARRRKARAPS